MRYLGAYFFCFLLLVGCSSKEEATDQVDYLLSKNPSLLFQIHHKDQFVNQLIHNDFWKNYFKYYPNQNVQNLLRSLPEDDHIWVAYTHDGVYLSATLEKQDSLSVWKNLSSGKLDSLTVENKKWYYITKDKEILISSLKDISFPETPVARQEAFHKVAKTISGEVPANIFLAQKKNKEFIGGIFPERIVKHLDGWTAWDIYLEKNTLRMSGSLLRPADSLPQLPIVPSQKNTIETYAVIPQTAQGISCFSFEEKVVPEEFYFDFQQDISSVTFFDFQRDSMAVLRSSNPEETLRYFTILKSETFQGETLHHIEEFSDIQSFFSIFERELQPKYLYRNEENLIFAQNKEALEALINAIQMKQTLSQGKSFEALQQKSSSQNSFITIENLQEQKDFSAKYASLAQRYAYASLQISPQDEFYQLTLTTTADTGGSSTTTAPSSEERGISERFLITLDKEALTQPVFVTNHRTGQKEVVIQDTDNQLYLIGNDGKILWKKRLDAPIVGGIHQVDLFQNGFLQMAFNTASSFWILDRNGNVVAPFPISYKEKLLPLQVFDYERNREYRFVVCSEKTIRLIDKRGDIVKGFEKSQVPNGLAQTPQHFRIAGKDFIVFPEKNGTLSILHRNGTVRIPISQKFDFSDNPISTYKDFFCFTTKAGKLFFVDTNGGVRSESIGEGNFSFDCQRDIKVLLHNNILTINQTKVELPYADYGGAKLHWESRNPVISVFDRENSRLYLLNTQGEIYSQFPVFSLSQADVTQDKGKLLLAFLKEKNVLCVSEQ